MVGFLSALLYSDDGPPLPFASCARGTVRPGRLASWHFGGHGGDIGVPRTWTGHVLRAV